MGNERRLMKWLVVLVPIVGAGLAIYPPDRKLKAGIDLAGGSSLLFEIDTSGLEPMEKVGLAERVMEVLKRRVDPNGQMNLVWRPIGNNRLEIQMPRPPKAALQRRQVWEEARAKLMAMNINRQAVETMLHLDAAEREQAKEALVRGVEGRGEALDALIGAYDAYEAGEGDPQTLSRDYEEKLAAVLLTSLGVNRFTDVLALGKASDRAVELGRLREQHPSYGAVMDEGVAAYDAWAAEKGMLEDPSDLKRRIRGAGVLEFRILAERDSSNPTQTAHKEARLQQSIEKYVSQLQERGPRRRAGDGYQWFEAGDVLDFTYVKTMEILEASKDTLPVIVDKYAGRWYVLAHAEQAFGLTRDGDQKWKLVDAYRGVDGQTGAPAVDFVLDARGGRQFAELTANNLQRPLAIFLDNVAQSQAVIQSMIREHGQISGRNQTQDTVTELVTTLRAGSLPARLVETPLMENTVGPSLGTSNRVQGTRAALYGAILVGVFMLVYYMYAGLVANVALVLNLLFTLAIMAMMQATFTLPGIAGLILTVGMAVDANILIYERIREERDRGIGLRKAVKTGYERVMSTIVDANVTTLITCIVLGYVGTEEVKGFAMVLGFGVVTSMFTALYVTRLIFETLIDARLLRSLPMLRLMHRPQIDWLGLRRMFWPVSVCMVGASLALTVFMAATKKEALFDIEFLGGTSVQIELERGETVTDEDIRDLVTRRGGEGPSVVNWLLEASDKLAKASVSRGASASSYRITCEGLSAEQLEALTRAELEPLVDRGGFVRDGAVLVVEAKIGTEGNPLLDAEKARDAIAESQVSARRAANNLNGARIQTVQPLETEGESAPAAFEVITVETNKELVQTAILAVMGAEESTGGVKIPKLNVERAVSFQTKKDPRLAPEGHWPIQDGDQYLAEVIEEPGARFDIRAFKGGVAFVFENLMPALTTREFEKRVREIRLQPEFSQYEVRPFAAYGLEGAGHKEGEAVFSRIAYVVVDENLPYYDDPTGVWEEQVAQLELRQASQALGTEKSLRKVNQFAAQIASQTAQQAMLAVALSLLAIVAYIWIRFGQMQFGLAAIVSLGHDVTITLGFVAVSHYVYATGIGRSVGLMDFKIDLPMIAAFLTIIGYSLNDTIVIFDRIRENRGKLKTLTPAIINNSINQCMSRTVLTSLTTLVAVTVMYAMGGPGIHGFSFAMIVGVLAGGYSTVAIAVPLVYRPKVLYVVVYIMIALGVFGAFSVLVAGVGSRNVVMAIAAAVIGIGLLWAILMETRSRPGGVAGATS